MIRESGKTFPPVRICAKLPYFPAPCPFIANAFFCTHDQELIDRDYFLVTSTKEVFFRGFSGTRVELGGEQRKTICFKNMWESSEMNVFFC